MGSAPMRNKSLLSAPTILVNPFEVAPGLGMALISGKLIPFLCFGIVLLYALAIIVLPAQIPLGTRVALLGGKPVPFHCFGIVLRHTFTIRVYPPEIKLCIRIALIGSDAVHHSVILPGMRVPLIGGEPVPFYMLPYRFVRSLCRSGSHQEQSI